MTWFNVLFRIPNKAATDFIEPRKEDGHGSAVAAPSFVTDKPDVMEASTVTLVASTSTPFTFSAAVEVVRIKNWETTQRLLVKSSAISSDADAAATRHGIAPDAGLANSEFYPVSGTIHIRCAVAAEVSVEGFKKIP